MKPDGVLCGAIGHSPSNGNRVGILIVLQSHDKLHSRLLLYYPQRLAARSSPPLCVRYFHASDLSDARLS